MKIFTLSLSLELSVFQPEQSYDFDSISWQSLCQQMDQNLARNRQFFIRDTRDISPAVVFELQADIRWQESQSAIKLLFPNQGALTQFKEAYVSLFTPKLAAGDW